MSPDDPKRDKDTKSQEYARAGIPEYWLVDVVEGTVMVFCLPADGWACQAREGRNDRRLAANPGMDDSHG